MGGPLPLWEQVQRVGRYELREELGVGGFATVYRAYDPVLDCEVALKVLHAHRAHDTTVRERFLQEGRALAQFRHHPHVVKVLDAGQVDGAAYLAMELIDGRTLQAVISERGAMPLADVVEIADQIASALAALHARKLVHRDVKPANIMIEAGSHRAVLLDLGIARITDSKPLTVPGQPVGTVPFMAPEQLQGIGQATTQTDVYQLGATVYALLTGHPPFHGEYMQVRNAIMRHPPRDLSDLRSDLPAGAVAVVMQAMVKDPVRRPDGARLFATRLRAAAGLEQDSRTIPSQRFPSTNRGHRQRLRIRDARTLISLGAVIGALALGTVMLPRACDRPRPSKESPLPTPPPVSVRGPVVANLMIRDSHMSPRTEGLEIGDAFFACFSLTPGADDEPLTIVAIPAVVGLPRDANDQSVIARSAKVPQEAGEACHAIQVLAPPLASGTYWVSVFHGSNRIESRSVFMKTKSGDILLQDDMEDVNKAQLPTASRDPRYELGYQSGEYVIRKIDPGWEGVAFATVKGTYDNAHITVEAQLVGDTADRVISLACRNTPSGGHYRLVVDPGQGRFAIFLYSDQTKPPVALADWQSSPAINKGERKNLLQLSCAAGGIIVATINGVKAKTARDDTHSKGTMWIGANLFSGTSGTVEARFDNLKIEQE